jgi:prepilin-type N-terminal cleavage/methylation domain-containing protein
MHPMNTPGPARTLPPHTSGLAQGGFTLAELAIVLVILSLLAGGLMVPLGARIDARDRQLSIERLRDIQHALIGFAIIHGRLPCPSTEDDPGAPGYGIEDSPPCNTAREGRLPWLSLGLPPTDAWGLPRRSRSDDWGGHWHYRVDRAFANTAIGAATTPTDDLQIRGHDGSRITVTDSQAVAIVYSTGPNRRADGLNASYSTTYQAGETTPDHDDLLVWIGRPLLIARLAQAGRL